MTLDKAIPTRRTGVRSLGSLAFSGDVRNRVVGEFQVRSVCVRRRRTLALPLLARRPAAKAYQYAAYDVRVVDQRDHTHGPLADGAYERIRFVDFADEPRPGGLGADGDLAHRYLGCRGRLRGLLRLECLCPFATRAASALPTSSAKGFSTKTYLPAAAACSTWAARRRAGVLASRSCVRA